MKRLLLLVLAVLSLWGAGTVWGAAPTGRYLVTADTVTDSRTGLVWQRQVTLRVSLDTARSSCQQLNLGGFSSGWRVPTRKELETLVDRRIAPPGPTIDPTAFPGTSAAYFWSSTPVAQSAPPSSWKVDFAEGFTFFDTNTSLNWVRCVR